MSSMIWQRNRVGVVGLSQAIEQKRAICRVKGWLVLFVQPNLNNWMTAH